MFCTKCGANNEDGNAFCKNCGAKLVKPAVNSSVPSSSGVAQAAKAVNVKLIVGIAAAVIVVVVAVVVVLMNVGKGGDSLFEQIKIGKTTVADVEKYFDKHNLVYDWGIENTMYGTEEGIWLEIPYGFATGWDFDMTLVNSPSRKDLFEKFMLHNDLSDTLWGANCDYFLAMSGDINDNDKDRKVLCTACIIEVDDNAGEKEFRQNLNNYLKEYQKTGLENREYDDKNDPEIDFVFYPLEITTLNGEKMLTCLNCNYGFINEGYIFLALYVEPYYTENELNKILNEDVVEVHDHWFDADDTLIARTGPYYTLTIVDMYPEFQEGKQGKVQALNENTSEEFPYLECSIGVSSEGDEYVAVKFIYDKMNGMENVVIPDKIQGHPVREISSVWDRDEIITAVPAYNEYRDILKNIKSVSIPDSVTVIGDFAFSGWTGLTDIVIPKNIVSIGEGAFRECSSLTRIDLPKGLTDIGRYAFNGCHSLTSIELLEGLTNIGECAFLGCSSLTAVDLPEGLTSIGGNAFCGCSSLTSIELPKGLTSIGDSAFEGCDSLTSVDLPEGLTNIGEKVFYECRSLSNVVFPKGLTSIGLYTFAECTSLTSVDLSEGLTNIEEQAFGGCSSLTNIKIPSSVVFIDEDAFSGCFNLNSDELSAKFPDAIPKNWFEMYKDDIDYSNYMANEYGYSPIIGVCFLKSADNNIPYLGIQKQEEQWISVYVGSCSSGSVNLSDISGNTDIEYNPITNKIWSVLLDDSSEYNYLYNLYTGTRELSLKIDRHTDYSNYFEFSMQYADWQEISEEEYNSAINEARSQFEEGSTSITWYDTVDEAYQAYISNGGSVSAINASESADTALSIDNINIDVESEVKQIRQWYSDTQNGLGNLMYSKYGDDIEYYFELGYAVKSIIPSGYDGWDYTRQYFYKDQKLYFAFVFKGSEEYRVYFKDGKVIRYIDNNGTVFDYGNIGDGEQLGQKVIAESDKLYPEFNCGA